MAQDQKTDKSIKDTKSGSQAGSDRESQGGAAGQRATSMGFFEHLDELRGRVIRCAIIFFIGFFICFEFTNDLVLDFIRIPLVDAIGEAASKLNIISPFELFLNRLKMAAVTAVFLVSPFLFYQMWAFIAPGLYPKERKYVFPFILGATGCFLGGASFAYYVLFPIAFKFLIGNEDPNIQVMLSLGAYYSTCLRLLLLFGMAFELPVLLCFLGFLGIVDGSTLRKNRNSAIIGITVVCALFAPPDAISMLILMAPLILLYEISIYIVDFLGRTRSNKDG